MEGAGGGLTTRSGESSDFTFYPLQCNFLMIKRNKMQTLKHSLKLLLKSIFLGHAIPLDFFLGILEVSK